MAASPFDGLQPELLWRHFASLTSIPRCSGNEEKAALHVMKWASEKGFQARRDGAGNVVVRVPASPGKEGAAPVVLQGHLDMVGEKDSSSPHNFATDPIPVKREGDWITAEGTTLGADNAIGLAAAMAVAEDGESVHGPLELLLTVEEETGLTGAQAIEPGLVQGRTLLNLDSEEENAIYVGCAGGADTSCTLPVTREPAGGGGGADAALRVRVHGLKGGHSGLDINTGRANALKLLALFLDRLRQKTDFGLTSFAGGDKHNAIPREAEALILLDGGARAAADELLSAFTADLQVSYGSTDPGAAVTLEPADKARAAAPLSRASRDTLLDMVLAMPHGVLAMSRAVEGLVETSTNLAVVRLNDSEAFFLKSTRSSVMPAIKAIQAGIFAVARLAGADATSKGGYPGWQPNMDSPVLKRAREVHARALGVEPAIKAIHAGLECGIIGERCGGGMDMLSIGPHIEAPHSPSERVQISSVVPFYTFLKALLEDLAG